MSAPNFRSAKSDSLLPLRLARGEAAGLSLEALLWAAEHTPKA